MTIVEDRLALAATLTLDSGGHSSFESGMCAMEMASWLADEPWSASPKCVSKVITSFMVSWNDSLPTNADRDRLLKPLIPLTIGTRTSAKDETTRAWMATDWLVREQAPAWLRLAGLTEHAETLENLAALTGRAEAVIAQPSIKAASEASAAAGAAAWAAAGAAARDAAGAAAWAAAWAAAGAAAWAAARDALAPTVKILQPSAVLLVKRMCEVGR